MFIDCVACDKKATPIRRQVIVASHVITFNPTFVEGDEDITLVTLVNGMQFHINHSTDDFMEALEQVLLGAAAIVL